MVKVLKRRLDRAFRCYLIGKYNYCQHCGRKPPEVQLQIHHIYTRKNMALRWDVDNCVVVCARCHFYFHQNPIDFVDFIIKLKGKRVINRLKKKSKVKKVYTDREIEEMIRKFTHNCYYTQSVK